MTDIDEEIRKVLAGSELEKLDDIAGEPGLFTMLGDTFRGKMRFWNAYAMVLSFASFGAALWTGWRFLHTNEPHEMTLWGVGMGISIFFLAMLKLWFWMEMNKNTVIREIKRVELQLAVLSNAMREKEAL
ncbi:MAG: hypothetical protein Q9M33_01800 [Robiginitomaculum sp.]|nr:hypothetical protein [Robiginitomaculum sp.]MDQ7078180.1 hypothetical protein [Robiginitomaculum sp.]